MTDEPRGIYTLYSQLFHSSEEGINETRNSSPNVQGQKESKIQGLCSQEDEERTEAEA